MVISLISVPVQRPAEHIQFAARLFRLLAISAVVLWGSGVASQEVTPDTSLGAHGGSIRIGMNAPQTLDPALLPNDPETLFSRTIYDYLVDLLPDNTIAPNLATEYTISDDGLTYTFTLQDGVTFHDGSPFSSADVVYTFNRLREVGSPALNLLGEYTVEAPDASTVVFTLTEPNADFLFGVSSRYALILRDGAQTPGVLGEGDSGLANFNGTGPFVLESFSPGVNAVFVRNENYWQPGLPLLDRIEHVYIDDPIAQVDALRSGELDFIFKVPLQQVSAIEAQDNLVAIQTVTSGHPVIRLRTDQGVGTDVRVRQALKLATDRAQLNDLITEGRGIIGNNDPIAPVFADIYQPLDVPYDPEQARSLLVEAGYGDGLTLTLYTPDSLGYPDMAALLQQQWAQVGITLDIIVRPENIYYSTDEWLTVDLGITGYGSRPTPRQFLVEAYATGGIYNESHWSDPELDALIAQAGTVTDAAERAAIYADISAIFAERGPIIVPFFLPGFSAANTRVQGLVVAPFEGLTDFRQVSVSDGGG